MKHARLHWSIALLGLSLVGCPAAPPATDSSPPAGAASDAQDEAAQSARIELPASLRNNLGVRFAAVEVRRLERSIRVPGHFELVPRARHEYRMPLAGRIELAVGQYAEVRAGDLLFRFESPAWPELVHEIVVAEQDIAAGEAQLQLAEARLVEGEELRALHLERAETLRSAELARADLELGIAINYPPASLLNLLALATSRALALPSSTKIGLRFTCSANWAWSQ